MAIRTNGTCLLSHQLRGIFFESNSKFKHILFRPNIMKVLFELTKYTTLIDTESLKQ